MCETQNQSDIAHSTIQSKWRSSNYSRGARNFRKLLKSKHNTKITDYFSIITDEITDKTVSIIEDNNLSDKFENTFECVNNYCLNTSNSASFSGDSKTIINILKNTAIKNSKYSRHSKKYDYSLKSFCTYLYIVGGKLLYETLYTNLKDSIPSLTTIKRTLKKNGNMEEGVFRFQELYNFLLKNNYSTTIWISEDQTKILEKLQYDVTTNKIVGCVLELDGNGLVISDNLATSASIIEKLSEKEKSAYAYAILAQPLSNNAPSFCLSIYGSNNKFNYSDVLNRWTYMRQIADKNGISIAGFSADGDTRIMKAMRISTMFPYHDEETPICIQKVFLTSFNSSTIYVQDTVHIGTKLRTRLLNTKTELVMGKFVACRAHLEYLICTITKDQHLLIQTDINCEDKMNFEAVEKICKEKVLNLLQVHVEKSEGTGAYLKVMQYTLDSYLSKTLRATERIYKIWFAVLFVRIWRYWILQSEEYTLKSNFITSNAYLCMEFNAHALILAVSKFTSQKEEHLFLPWLYSSQPCEKFFRAARSMTSTFSTVVNFSLLDILRRGDRLQFINDVVSETGIIIYYFNLDFNKLYRRYLRTYFHIFRTIVYISPRTKQTIRITFRNAKFCTFAYYKRNFGHY